MARSMWKANMLAISMGVAGWRNRSGDVASKENLRQEGGIFCNNDGGQKIWRQRRRELQRAAISAEGGMRENATWWRLSRPRRGIAS